MKISDEQKEALTTVTHSIQPKRNYTPFPVQSYVFALGEVSCQKMKEHNNNLLTISRVAKT